MGSFLGQKFRLDPQRGTIQTRCPSLSSQTIEFKQKRGGTRGVRTGSRGVRTTVTLDKVVARLAERRMKQKGFNNNFSSYVSDLIRRDYEKGAKYD